MLLTLMRHGAAEPAGGRERPLTPDGHASMVELIDLLASSGWLPGAIVCSPLLRSRQTAQVLLGAYPGTPLEVLPELTDTNSGVLDELAWRELVDPVVIGHQPGLARLVGSLLGAQGALDFPPGAIACLRVNALPPSKPAELLFFVSPRLLPRRKLR